MQSLITEKNRKWWVLAAMTGSNALIFLDQSVLPVALPTIQRELVFSELILQWTINIYMLMLTIFALIGGRLGDILGHRRVFNSGLIIFALASAFCALSRNGGEFIASRALQGIGGAMMIPTSVAILTPAFPHNQQGKILGLYLSVGAFFLAVGPVVGGLLTQFISWRYVFWINVPISLLSLVLTFISVLPSEKKKEAFDYLGFFGLVLGIGGLITALMQGKYLGWSSWPTLTMSIGGIALIVMMVLFEGKVKDPFIDISLFRVKNFSIGVLCIFCIQFILILTVFWAIYFQKVLGYSPSFAGVWSMIACSPVIFIGTVSGHLFDRYGPKLPIVIGLFLVSFAIGWFYYFPTPTNSLLLVPVVLPFGCGVPLIIIPSFALFLKAISPQKRGIAVGISTTLRQLGSTAGMAVFGAYFIGKFETHFDILKVAEPDMASLQSSSFEGLLSKSPRALEAIQALPSGLAEKVQNVVIESTVYASNSLNLLGLFITLGTLLLAIIFLKKGRTNVHSHSK